MKSKFAFPMLLIMAVLFMNLPTQAQSVPFVKPIWPNEEFVNFDHHVFTQKDVQMINHPFPAQNTTNRLQLPDNMNQENFLKNTKNTDGLIYVYDSVWIYQTNGELYKQSTTRDASGKMLSLLYQDWDTGNNTWVNEFLLSYTYDDSGKMISALHQNWVWVSYSYTWVNYALHSYNYDAYANLLSDLYQSWDTGTNTWYNSSLVSYTYDASGNMLSELYQYANSNTWVNNEKRSYTYDASGNMLSYLEQYWETGNNAWLNNSLESNTYDASGNWLSGLSQEWDAGSNSWVNDELYIFTYDTSGKLLTILYQYWEPGTNTWINGMMGIFNYDAFGNQISVLYQFWDSGNNTWVNAALVSITYDAVGNMLLYLYQNWSSANNAWVNSIKTEYQYDYINKKIVAQFFEWNQGWVPAIHQIYISFFGNDLYNWWGFKIELYYSIYEVTDIEENTSLGKSSLAVYPNPASGQANISFDISESGNYQLAVYDLEGRQVKSLLSSELTTGHFVFSWNGANNAGVPVKNGVYFMKLTGENKSFTSKVVLMR